MAAANSSVTLASFLLPSRRISSAASFSTSSYMAIYLMGLLLGSAHAARSPSNVFNQVVRGSGLISSSEEMLLESNSLSTESSSASHPGSGKVLSARSSLEGEANAVSAVKGPSADKISDLERHGLLTEAQAKEAQELSTRPGMGRFPGLLANCAAHGPQSPQADGTCQQDGGAVEELAENRVWRMINIGIVMFLVWLCLLVSRPPAEAEWRFEKRVKLVGERRGFPGVAPSARRRWSDVFKFAAWLLLVISLPTFGGVFGMLEYQHMTSATPVGCSCLSNWEGAAQRPGGSDLCTVHLEWFTAGTFVKAGCACQPQPCDGCSLPAKSAIDLSFRMADAVTNGKVTANMLFRELSDCRVTQAQQSDLEGKYNLHKSKL